MSNPNMAPNPANELEAQVQNALDAAQINDTMRTLEVGSATEQVKRLESAGDSALGPFVQRSSEFQNTPGEGIGELKSVNVNADVVKNSDNGTRMEYQVKTRGVYNPDTKQDEYGRITRETADGEKYEHRIKNPKAAQKLGSLIAKQVAERAQNDSAQEKAA